ncbi:hypothetical protein CYMTET_15384 [Cymbomonas tetramitiformis]|uniref:catechol O-methyltransferase n=1 Tax=Cymbomonas tetramitiformis TaxID=36881 RepID=A0AAE0L9E3_9CHLO|nr:hypothetical protein CYMTET_15384 [Cymbomonas tetramitiformis]
MALQIGLLTAANSSVAASFNAEFYAEWPYAQPKDILPYVFENSQRGDLGAIISAIDKFGDYYPMYKCGDEKGLILETLVKDANPKHVVELGTFLGYSAVRMNSQLQKGAQFITVEAKPENADVARSIIEYAGFGDQVTLLKGRLAKDALPDVSKILNGSSADFVFLDHFKDCYLPDLKAMEQLGIVGKGSVIVADNVLYPGAPGFLEYVSDSSRYDTRLIPAKFEYDQKWKPDWTPQDDAISVSVFL